MNSVLFSLKRAFHSSLAMLRSFLRGFDLTPARFDLLFCVRERRLKWQSQVRDMLGVTSATVSRMLKSLAERGLVRLSRSPVDRRQQQIELTPKGEASFRTVKEALCEPGHIELFVESIFAPKYPGEPPVVNVARFERALCCVRYECYDKAGQPYFFDPEDDTLMDSEAQDAFYDYLFGNAADALDHNPGVSDDALDELRDASALG